MAFIEVRSNTENRFEGISKQMEMLGAKVKIYNLVRLWRQRGRVVSATDSQSGGPGFKYCSCHLLDLFSVILSSGPWPHL